jgi:predicted dehydrogenase
LKHAGERPLFYREVSGTPARFPRAERAARSLLEVTGVLDFLKRIYRKRRPQPPADIARTTYLDGGQTDQETQQILRYGRFNLGRRMSPPVAPATVKRRLGVCVVGSGWGSFHCSLLRKVNPETRLFVCGRDPARTARLARAIGAEGMFRSMEEAVADSRVQALTFALPHDLHRRAVELAAAAGKHALVEKPIATSLADADAMIEAAQRANICFMVAEDMHFRPAIHKALRVIQSGLIGEPLYLLAHAGGIRRPSGWAAEKQRMGGGVLMDIGVHYVHGLRMLFGEPDRAIASRAMQINTKMEAEDSVQLIFSSRYGWEAQLLLSWASDRGNLPDYVLLGSGGTLHLWPHEHHLDYYPVAPRSLTRLLSYVRPHWLQEKLMRPGLQRVRIPLRQADPTGYSWEMREFLTAVIEERSPALPPEEARRDLEIVLRCYEALESARPVEIP